MSEKTATKDESTESRINIERRNEATVRGAAEDVDAGHGLLDVTRGFDDLHFEVEGWHSDAEKSPEWYDSRENCVNVKVTTADNAITELTLLTEVDADRARALGRSLLAAADVADGETVPEADE